MTPSFEVEEGGGGEGGVQAETTIYFWVRWVLFEYSSFDHFPKTIIHLSLGESGRYLPSRETAW